MKRNTILVAAVLCVLALGAAAQGRGKSGAQEPVRFGSVERTKLLQQAGRGRNADEDVLKLGGVERRAALTGKAVQHIKPLSERNHSRTRGCRR